MQLKNVNIVTLKGREIVRDLSFNVNNGDKIAIIGEEGNGKSTLLKAIFDESLVSYCVIDGYVDRRYKLGYLEQSLDKWNSIKICDFVLMKEVDSVANYEIAREYYKYASLFDKLNIDKELLYSERLVGSLSGGEKVKLGILKLIISDPDIYLLDEPTNDLDINTLKWLENFIVSLDKPVIYISHDEVFLENTANKVIHLEQLNKKSKAKSTFVNMSYIEYVNFREQSINNDTKLGNKQREEYKNKMDRFRVIHDKVNHKQETITRADPHGGKMLKRKMQQVKSMEKRFYKEKENFIDIPDPEESINLFFREVYIPSNKKILDINLNELKNNSKLLCKNINLQVYGPKKISIVGKNGVGKTTLLKYIFSELSLRTDLKVGYMPQEYVFEDVNAVEFLSKGTSEQDYINARMLMGNMKFTYEEMETKINNLSGGSKAKLYLMKLVLDECNVLILDEPTRNLSPLSNPVIRKMLIDFKGAVIAVSHDRKFTEEVSKEVYEINKNGLVSIKLS